MTNRVGDLWEFLEDGRAVETYLVVGVYARSLVDVLVLEEGKVYPRTIVTGECSKPDHGWHRWRP